MEGKISRFLNFIFWHSLLHLKLNLNRFSSRDRRVCLCIGVCPLYWSQSFKINASLKRLSLVFNTEIVIKHNLFKVPQKDKLLWERQNLIYKIAFRHYKHCQYIFNSLLFEGGKNWKKNELFILKSITASLHFTIFVLCTRWGTFF